MNYQPLVSEVRDQTLRPRPSTTPGPDARLFVTPPKKCSHTGLAPLTRSGDCTNPRDREDLRVRCAATTSARLPRRGRVVVASAVAGSL